MLPNRPSDVIDLNEAGARVVDIKRPFFIGSDGGEEWYFVDASEPDSAVYVYELETGRHRALVASWAAYLGCIRDAHAEIARRIALGGPCRRIERPAHDAAYHDDEQRRERRDEHGADHQEAVAGGAHGGEQFVVERDAADEPLPLRNRRERHEFRGRAAIVRGRVGRSR